MFLMIWKFVLILIIVKGKEQIKKIRKIDSLINKVLWF